MSIISFLAISNMEFGSSPRLHLRLDPVKARAMGHGGVGSSVNAGIGVDLDHEGSGARYKNKDMCEETVS